MASVTVTDPSILTDLVAAPSRPEPDDRAEAKHAAYQLLTGNLTASQHEVIQLRLEGFSLAKIADTLGISVWSVRGRLDRAHAAIHRAADTHYDTIATLLGWSNTDPATAGHGSSRPNKLTRA
jgi:DNA-directed RNA polymerase specialized sigma24 family protein